MLKNNSLANFKITEKRFLLIMGIIILGILVRIFSSSTNKNAPATQPAINPTVPINKESNPGASATTAKERIEKARELYKQIKEDTQYFVSNAQQIRDLLAKIKPGMPEYREAQIVSKQLHALDVTQRKIELEDRKAAILLRRDYARQFEGNLLTLGMDATARVQGSGATTIIITHVMINRPTVYQFQNDEATLSALRKYGFKRVVLSDGFGQSWELKL